MSKRKSFAEFLKWVALGQVPVDGSVWEPAGALKFYTPPVTQKEKRPATQTVSEKALPVAASSGYCASCP